jgi:murein L,D-transpeptidase YafK
MPEVHHCRSVRVQGQDRVTVHRAVILGMLAVVMAGAVVAGERFRPHEPLPPGARADRVLVLKSERRLTLLRSGDELRSYRIALGGSPIGHKTRQGDSRTPEGVYTIDYRNLRSAYHRSLHISYPNAADRAAARAAGVVSPGGDIMIHGIRNGMGWLGDQHRRVYWTDGCIAVTNLEIEEIWDAVADGTPIEIRP